MTLARIMRFFLALVLVLFAAFCTFGFFASFEPGVDVVFRIGYPILSLIFLVLAAFLVFKK